MGVSRNAQTFGIPPIISGTDKATDFKFCRNIHMVDQNKSSWKMLGMVAVSVVRESRKFSGHPCTYRAHCAVISAIAQLSCMLTLLVKFLARRQQKVVRKTCKHWKVASSFTVWMLNYGHWSAVLCPSYEIYRIYTWTCRPWLKFCTEGHSSRSPAVLCWKLPSTSQLQRS